LSSAGIGTLIDLSNGNASCSRPSDFGGGAILSWLSNLAGILFVFTATAGVLPTGFGEGEGD